MTYQELYHHGILGQKWGVRRYQNADGTLTAAGRKHYRYDDRPYNDIDDPMPLTRSELRGIRKANIKRERAKKMDAKAKNLKKKMFSEEDIDKSIETSMKSIMADERVKKRISSGFDFTNNHAMTMQNLSVMEASRMASEEASRVSINASLQGASLAMSGGANPFMFGAF